VIAELTQEQKRTIWERQKGMCAVTGKKFENFDETADAEFLIINPDLPIELSNVVMMFKSADLSAVKRTTSDGKIYLRRYLMPYANLENFSKEEFASEINIDIELVTEEAKNSTNWKEVRNKIRDLISILNSYQPPLENKNVLLDKLNSSLEILIARQKEETEKTQAEQIKNYEQIKAVVDEAIKFANEAQSFNEAREKLINAKSEFRKLSLKREHAEEILTALNNAIENINNKIREERENYEMECSENYHILKAKVEATVEKASKATHFKSARQSLIDLQAEIKDKKLKRNQREELYQIIRECFEGINQRQQQERQMSDADYEENYQKIKKIVDEAISFAENVTTSFKEAKDTLIAAQAAIKAAILRKAQKDELFGNIRRVFEAINEKQNADRENYDKEANENYSKLSAKIEEAFVYLNNTSDFRLLRENIIGIQSEVRIMKLKREQRAELLEKIQKAFAIIDKLKNEYFEKRKQERIIKLNETLSNLELKIQRLEESIAADKQTIETIKSDEISEAEKEEKIKTIQERISEKEQKIAETRTRIEELQKEKEKIQQQ
jgi:nucleoprotein TPR